MDLLSCSICSGAGYLRGAPCSACQGLGTGTWIDGVFVYLAERFDAATIRAEGAIRIVQRLIMSLLFIFGLAGIGIFLVVFGGEFERLPQLFTRQDAGLKSLFWLSLFTDAYLFYRFAIEVKGARRVHRRRFGGGEMVSAEVEGTTLETIDRNHAVHVIDTMTEGAWRVLRRAWQYAAKLGNSTVMPEHLLAALIEEKRIAAVFGRLEVASDKFVDGIRRLLARAEQGHARIEVGAEFRSVVLAAYAEAYNARRPFVDVLELLSALAGTESGVRELFDVFALDLKKIRDVTHWFHIDALLRERMRRFRGKAALRPKGPMDRAMTAVATPFLDQYSHDLTQLAKAGALAPCVGRDKEIDAILRVLEGGKTSVVLVGNPGVGKTKVVEGIAERILTEEVPAVLHEKRLISLSIPAFLSGGSAIGELEERLYRIMHEIDRAGNVVLFLDNLQSLVGITTEGGETFDLSHVLADGLQKGVFLAIGSTTPADYSRYLERSSALATVMQKVEVPEMDVDQALLVLQAKVGSIEYKYSVYFSYESLVKAASLAKQFIQDRYLPDKAIKLIEEVAAFVRNKKGRDAVVHGEDIATIVTEKTHIPVTTVTASEKEKLLNLEERMHERIIGQDEAVRHVARALRRARAELRDVKRPIANFLFLGPTGVGKTELAKTVADIYFGSEDAMVRLDMSEYQEQSAMNRLIGAPVGYTGGGEGGFLTEAVRKRPFSLVLLDELEKANADVLNLFLQVMDDGRLTDTAGRTIDFTNTITIGTSNAGTQFIQDAVRAGQTIEQIKEQLIQQELRPFFRPEFLNRFDAIIVFKPLTFEEIVQITRLLLKKVAKRLEEKGMHFRASDAAIEELARVGFDPTFGARPLRRAIQEHVDDALAKALLEGSIGRRDTIILEEGGKIQVEKAREI
ncbi:ATP-dependent Clp protease ATP-binding subunit [Candidatus Uhrbacteria bacterium]|nr:ATP-dependent Clp protease ATP-binding subunit [Candidatus Uhrbacteria bacterium]